VGPLVKLKRYLILTAIAIATLGAKECDSPPPIIRAKQWLGSSERAAIVSSRSEVLNCSDARFDNFVCLTLSDQRRVLKTLVSCCESWRNECAEQVQASD